MRAVLLTGLSAALTLTACDNGAPSARVELSAAEVAGPQVMESPDTALAVWSVSDSGRTINFGNEAEPPMMSLDCLLGEGPPQMRIIRHADTRPGKSALFPVIGNQIRSRFLVDAALEAGEWRWQGTVSAEDPKLDVFTGSRQLLATLPGGGMLNIDGSTIPWQFVTWCRGGGSIDADEAARIAAQAVEPRQRVVNPLEPDR